MNEGVIPCPNQSEDNRKGINSVYASARQIILQKNRAEPFKTAEQQQILNLLTAYLETKKKKKACARQEQERWHLQIHLNIWKISH